MTRRARGAAPSTEPPPNGPAKKRGSRAAPALPLLPGLDLPLARPSLTQEVAQGRPAPGAEDEVWNGLPIKPLSLDELVCGEAESWACGRRIAQLIGLDEAGRGPLAGPVVVAACALPTTEHEALAQLDDSKRLDEATRDALFTPIRELALGYAIAVIDHLTIDTMNILRASLHGMFVAWQDLVTTHPELARAPVLVDGRDRAPLPSHVLQRPLIKGDARSRNIAAASILAKVTRDRLMVEAHATWPEYGFDRHKGYPTPAHRKAIAEYGPCPIHRRSFSFVAEHDHPSAGANG